MKTTLLSFLCFLVLSASKCKKEVEDCHYVITIKNNSLDKVIYSKIGTLGTDSSMCLLTKRAELLPEQSYKETLLRTCWEDELKYRNIEFYIVKHDNFNQGGFYDCDSIELKNAILKHYIITKKDLGSLRSNNFIITYP